ncbi:hypothetical protein N657DRAFT_484256 [Parathielavia appendiculata]|uniref:Uncharacterized protein n=1 Tax=Parathielavia appendiculata TaxID=2587402 RepID=A0AAN6Z285_9PEZI|nr:hypothetical protein N657DRAFT_484256 [Parathielavia appendiculata]
MGCLLFYLPFLSFSFLTRQEEGEREEKSTRNQEEKSRKVKKNQKSQKVTLKAIYNIPLFRGRLPRLLDIYILNHTTHLKRSTVSRASSPAFEEAKSHSLYDVSYLPDSHSV